MRAPPLLLVLLMAAAGLAVSPLAHLNPWLSACDLEEEAASGARSCSGAACSGGGSDVLVERDVAALCALGASPRARRLAQLRLRACCERSPASALDPGARVDVLAGGQRCELTLHHLLRLDDMVARVHCDFVDILGRYDCDQSYSVHTCFECQETYRRWACSTLVPLWVEEGGEEEEAGRTRRERPAEHAARWHARHLERVGHLDRRRGGSGGSAGAGGVVGRWVRAAAAGPGRPLARLKPCLSVCQLVEQHCPYFLPADRAPAYPTQYAGEPTFLCLDERIPETGGQANKSNYGGDECCYWYCEGRLCYRCEARLDAAERPAAETCAPIEERVPECSVPYQAPSAAPAQRPHAALALAAPLLLLVLALAATRHAHTHRTLSTCLVNVRDSRL